MYYCSAFSLQPSAIVQPSAFSLQPSAKIPFIIVKDTTKALADIARFNRQKFNIPVIAVSGSNGKTTTKEMVSWVLSKKFRVLKNEGTKNNHIGLPLTLLKLDFSFDVVVLELGTNHFHEIENLAKICLPNIGIITNVASAHLEHFGNLSGVMREKYSLIKNLQNPRIGILNRDDQRLEKKISGNTGRHLIFSFAIQNRSDFTARNIHSCCGRTEFSVAEQKFVINTWGEYNIYNALAAISLGRIFGLTYLEIAERLACFEFPQGRLKAIIMRQATLIDDTYNANPFSLSAALNAFKKIETRGRKILVMGDMLELGAGKELLHAQAGREAAEVCDIFITVGKLSKFAAASAAKFGLENIFSCRNSCEAGKVLFNKICPVKDDVILVKGSRAMKMEGVFR
ncbi:MAG: UDP-N-acetylmuramoyl-tripeptide--D-alanyl-D-alanine ligase [Candidatus Omnitrophica bacterium]|nr:UDP-N-acetylmuramoyl-tripeptide--D-alanyl-D-alanine ligase [Candidatus Omnitrophota bacterium]